MKWQNENETTKQYDRLAIQAIITAFFGFLLLIFEVVLLTFRYSFLALIASIIAANCGVFLSLFYVSLTKAKEINKRFSKSITPREEAKL